MTAEYDRLAGEYGKRRKIQEGVLHALVEGGGLGKESRVLEIGTGTGNYLIALHELARGPLEVNSDYTLVWATK